MRQLNLPMILLTGLLSFGMMAGGCSYRPLYGTKEGDPGAAAALSGIVVEEQGSRAGQLVRNDLMLGLGNRAGSNADFQLKLEPTEKTSLISSVPGQKLQRRRYRLNVKYVLLNVATGKVASEGASFSNVSYDTVQEPVADLQAADNAKDRASREVAEDIRLRLAAFVSAANG